MKQFWGRARRRIDRVSVTIYAALLLFGVGAGLLVGNSAPDLFVMTVAIGSFALAVILVALAIVWMLEETRRNTQAILGVVYPPEETR